MGVERESKIGGRKKGGYQDVSKKDLPCAELIEISFGEGQRKDNGSGESKHRVKGCESYKSIMNSLSERERRGWGGSYRYP